MSTTNPRRFDFFQMIFGELYPKNLAIADAEPLARGLARSTLVYLTVFGWLIGFFDKAANRLVRASGVEPVESAAVGGQDIATIRQLVEHSAQVGTLKPHLQQQISSLIDLGTVAVDTLLVEGSIPTYVAHGASVADVRTAALGSGHLRILVLCNDAKPLVVHLRDTLLEPDARPAHELARDVLLLDAQTPVYEALTQMRKSSVQFAVVMKDGHMRGVVTLADILERVLPVATSR